MKKIIAAIVFLAAFSQSSYSQNLNWRSLGENRRNVVQLNLGYDYGVTAQVGYNRAFAFFRPVVLGIDFSLPMGSDLLDDFKVRLGGQMEIVEIGGFSASLKISSVFRRYENELVRIASFGADLGIVAGYYNPSWHVAAELGFDKSITSYLKHSDTMKSYFPKIRDGWYIPSGGHWYYGIQGGKTIGESLDLSLRLGATNAQHNDEEAVLPYYLQLGLGVRF